MEPRQVSTRRRALEKATGGRVYTLSGVAGTGLPEVLRAIWSEIEAARGGAEQEAAPWHP